MRDGVVPFYIVCDESYSMADHIVTMNDAVRELHEHIRDDRELADTARLCVIGFSDSARVVVPLSATGELTEEVNAQASAATNFAAVFALLRNTIQRDITALDADAYQVFRPTVFFLSDGQATDPAVWSAAYQQLVDPNWAGHPRIVALEIGDADIATIRGISTIASRISDDESVCSSRPLHDRLRTSMARAIEDARPIVNISPRVGDYPPSAIDPVRQADPRLV